MIYYAIIKVIVKKTENGYKFRNIVIDRMTNKIKAYDKAISNAKKLLKYKVEGTSNYYFVCESNNINKDYRSFITNSRQLHINMPNEVLINNSDEYSEREIDAINNAINNCKLRDSVVKQKGTKYIDCGFVTRNLSLDGRRCPVCNQVMNINNNKYDQKNFTIRKIDSCEPFITTNSFMLCIGCKLSKN